jgi:hypothetical protein
MCLVLAVPKFAGTWIFLILRAFPLRACPTSALLLMPRVLVGLLLVIVLLLKSILAFRPVIGVFLDNPGVLFLLPRTMVVLAACMFLAVVAVVAVVPSASSAFLSLFLLPLLDCAKPRTKCPVGLPCAPSTGPVFLILILCER